MAKTPPSEETLPEAQPADDLQPGWICVRDKDGSYRFKVARKIILTARDEKPLELRTQERLPGECSRDQSYLHPVDYARLANHSGLTFRDYSWKDTAWKMFRGSKALLFWAALVTFAAATLTVIGVLLPPSPPSDITVVQADTLVRTAAPQSTKSQAAVACLEQLAGVNVGAGEVDGVSCHAPSSTPKLIVTLLGGLVTFVGAILTLIAALLKNYAFQSDGP